MIFSLNLNSFPIYNHRKKIARSANKWIRLKGSKSGDYEEIREKQFTKLLSNGSLLLQNVKEDREGFYLCQAHNGIGSGISKVIQLKVNCKYILLLSSTAHFIFYNWNKNAMHTTDFLFTLCI